MYQTILNNPLADSFTLGLASGASLGSGLALFFGLSFLWLPLFSIVFSLVTLMLVLSLLAGYSYKRLSNKNAYSIRFDDWCIIKFHTLFTRFNQS